MIESYVAYQSGIVFLTNTEASFHRVHVLDHVQKQIL